MKNRLSFDKITDSLMVGTFLRHSVVVRWGLKIDTTSVHKNIIDQLYYDH